MRGGLISRTARRLSHILTAPFQVAFRKAKRMVSPESFSSKVLSDVRKGINQKKNKKERTIGDYFSFGHYYVLKRMVYVVLLLLAILPVLYVKLLHPILISQFFTKTMVINSTEMVGYSGKVELVSQDDGTLIFQGKMEEGRINGKGQLYTYTGALLYDGNFEMEAYSGEGELYYENTDILCYKGNFLLNQYDGQGFLYDEDGRLKYKGDFKNGLYEGNGTLYFPNGQEEYVGTFAKGEKDGKGTLYDEDGNVVAEGTFEDGEPELQAVVMEDEDGTVLYDGTVNKDGEYEGEGKLYEDGALVYEGDFVDGKKEGSGTEYDEDGNVAYEGDFVNDVYEGEGKLYASEPSGTGNDREGETTGGGAGNEAGEVLRAEQTVIPEAETPHLRLKQVYRRVKIPQMAGQKLQKANLPQKTKQNQKKSIIKEFLCMKAVLSTEKKKGPEPLMIWMEILCTKESLSKANMREKENSMKTGNLYMMVG